MQRHDEFWQCIALWCRGGRDGWWSGDTLEIRARLKAKNKNQRICWVGKNSNPTIWKSVFYFSFRSGLYRVFVFHLLPCFRCCCVVADVDVVEVVSRGPGPSWVRVGHPFAFDGKASSPLSFEQRSWKRGREKTRAEFLFIWLHSASSHDRKSINPSVHQSILPNVSVRPSFRPFSSLSRHPSFSSSWAKSLEILHGYTEFLGDLDTSTVFLSN